MSLARIGFMAEEIHGCVAWRDARLGVRAEIHEEKAVLLLSTGLRLDLYLDGSYVLRRGFAVHRRNHSFGVCALTDFRALGRSRPHDAATFSESHRSNGAGRYAGRIGVEYWRDGVLGLDAAGPSIALSTGEAVREHFSDATCRIPLVSDTDSALPVTTEVEECNAHEGRPALLIDTAGPISYLTWSYVQSHWRERKVLRAARRALKKGGTVNVEVLFPHLDPVRVDFRIRPSPPDYVVDIGVPEIHGVLGIDVLRRWMQVFDIPGRELALFNY